MSRPGLFSSASKATALFNNPKFGDCKIVCDDGREFYCSKWKLAEQSEFFYKILSGGWKESTSSVIQLEESDSSPIESMLIYLHTNTYTYPISSSSPPTPSSSTSITTSTTTTNPSPLQFSRPTLSNHISIFATADFYCVDSLKAKARELFEYEFPRHPINNSWFSAVEQVYTTTLSREGGLGEIIVKTALQKMYQLTEYPGERWLTLCLKHPDILRDLFRKLRAGPPPTTNNTTTATAAGGGGGGGGGGSRGIDMGINMGANIPRGYGTVPITGMPHMGGNFGGGGQILGANGQGAGNIGAPGNVIGGGIPISYANDDDDDDDDEEDEY